jgi:hypothetical protein
MNKRKEHKLEIKKLIFLDDTYLEDCILSHDVPKEIAEISNSFVKITTDKSTIQYVNLDYIQMIIPKKEKFKTIRSINND